MVLCISIMAMPMEHTVSNGKIVLRCYFCFCFFALFFLIMSSHSNPHQQVRLLARDPRHNIYHSGKNNRAGVTMLPLCCAAEASDSIVFWCWRLSKNKVPLLYVQKQNQCTLFDGGGQTLWSARQSRAECTCFYQVDTLIRLFFILYKYYVWWWHKTNDPRQD